jgi:hypothetical protein
MIPRLGGGEGPYSNASGCGLVKSNWQPLEAMQAPGKRRSRQCEVLLYFSEYATSQDL